MPEVFAALALLAATMAMGVMTGVFQHYAYAVMPGLGRTDDRTFVGAFQSIDRAIINPWFFVSFFGALVFTGVAAVLHLGAGARSALPWILAGLILYGAAFVITLRVNVPRNDEIKAAGDPNRIPDLAAVRARFGEATWVRWNIVRALLSTTALGCLIWALVLHGRDG